MRETLENVFDVTEKLFVVGAYNPCSSRGNGGKNCPRKRLSTKHYPL